MDHDTIILTRADVQRLLSMEACIGAIEDVFRKAAKKEVAPAGIIGMHVEGGGFHVKAAVLDDEDTRWFAAKTNANFPGNRDRFGLPTIQGVVLLFDAIAGRPLAILDSIELTAIRTGAATAVAARYLARPSSSFVTICGCGAQASAQLRALTCVLPLRHVRVFDIDEARARSFAQEIANSYPLDVTVAPDLRSALQQSDVVVTCTTSRRPFLMRDDVVAGTFIAAVGADNPEKQELDPELMARGKLVVDTLEQAASIGDLHHAIEAGAMTIDEVHAELGDIVVGIRSGRTSEDEVTIFDSTGTAIQDVAAAVLVYKAARELHVRTICLGAGLPPESR